MLNKSPVENFAAEQPLISPVATGIITALIGVTLYFGACIANGAVPGYLAPTTAQVAWSMGFAKSFLHDGPSVYAHSFGAPAPAAMAFGLAGALPAALFLALGLPPVDAYSAAFAFWLGIAFAGAFVLARRFGCGRVTALALTAIWLTLPVVWVHQIFGMVALGFALLPAYILAAIGLIAGGMTWSSVLVFLLACLVAVFMDGYSFMMFAMASGVIFVAGLISSTSRVSFLAARGSIVTLGFVAAYALYASYQGVLEFDKSPIDFFRGWAASLEFFALPARGLYLAPDLLQWGATRTPEQYYGDASTYMATFCLPLILATLFACWGRVDRHSIPFVIIGAFALYMAVGPTVKFLTYKPAGASPLMPASQGLFETGNAWISQHLPGFKNMRASYRWTALLALALWAVLALCIPRLTTSGRVTILALLFFFGLPTVGGVRAYAHYRSMMLAMDAEIAKMRKDFRAGETVAFLPYRNDFLANYMANDLGVRLYNAGGDKNMLAAVRSWPPEMRRFKRDTAGPQFIENVERVLTMKTVDAVVLPYIDLLWDAHSWPWRSPHKTEARALAAELEKRGVLTTTFADHYVIARPK